MKKKTSVPIACMVLLSVFALYSSIAQASPDEYFFKVVITIDAADTTGLEFLQGYAVPGMKEIGIDVEIDPVEYTMQMEMLRTQRKTYAEGGWDIQSTYLDIFSDPDQTLQYHSESVPPQGFNYMDYRSADSDRLLETGMSTFDPDERREVYQEFYKIILDELPVIPFYTVEGLHPFRAGIGGIETYAGERVANDDAWCAQFLTGIEGDTFHYAWDWDLDRFLPTFGYASTEGMFMRVFGTNIDGSVRPDLAESWEWAEDHSTLTINLREDVKWSDGVPFNSTDVKYTYELIMNPDTGSPDYTRMTTMISSIETPDAHTVVLNILPEGRSPALEEVLSWRGMGILPAHVLADVPAEELSESVYNQEPGLVPVTGPYNMIEANTGEYYKWERNPEWPWGPWTTIGPKYVICHVISEKASALAALEAGEVHHISWWYAAETHYEYLEANPDIQLTTGLTDKADGLFINLNHPILCNKWVRKAIAHAINSEAYVDDVRYGIGYPTSLPIRRVYWTMEDFPENHLIPYNLAEAKANMEKAGFDYDWLNPTTAVDPLYVGGFLVAGIAVGSTIVFVITRVRKPR